MRLNFLPLSRLSLNRKLSSLSSRASSIYVTFLLIFLAVRNEEMADEIAIADMTIDMMVKLLIVQIPDRFGDQVCSSVIAGLTGNP